jgi:hypothetical protein
MNHLLKCYAVLNYGVNCFIIKQKVSSPVICGAPLVNGYKESNEETALKKSQCFLLIFYILCF